MTDELMELGRRAVACPGWRWMPGVLDETTGDRVPAEDSPYDSSPDAWADAVPDLSDPATLGCLLALVREAWDHGGVFVEPYLTEIELPIKYRWEIGGVERRDGTTYQGTTEAEALVVALEAAPTTEEEPRTWEEDWGNERE